MRNRSQGQEECLTSPIVGLCVKIAYRSFGCLPMSAVCLSAEDGESTVMLIR